MLGAGLPSGFIPVEALGGVQRAPVQPAPVPYHGPVQPTTTPWGFPDPVRQPREFLEALIKRVEATDKENYFKVGRRQKSCTSHMRMLSPPLLPAQG
jgi:hypothetical protein